MGAGNSKPEAEYVFKANRSTSFSYDLLQSLQNSAETDSTRAKALELHIQTRVAEELEKKKAEEIERANAIADRINSEITQTGSITSETRTDASIDDTPGLFDRVAGAFESAESAEQRRLQSMSRQTVLDQIESLRKKLDERRQVSAVDVRVARAKENVITCLRLNDRRPLDCWQEVEAFKQEVGRLEEEYLKKTLG